MGPCVSRTTDFTDYTDELSVLSVYSVVRVLIPDDPIALVCLLGTVEVGLDILDDLVLAPGLLVDRDGVVVGKVSSQLGRGLFDPEPGLDLGQRLLALGQAAVVDLELAVSLGQPDRL